MPRRPCAVVLVVELDGLRIAEVPGVVAPAVAEVDPADERDVARWDRRAARRRASGGGCRRAGPAGRAAPRRRPRSRRARTTGSSPRRSSSPPGATATAGPARARRGRRARRAPSPTSVPGPASRSSASPCQSVKYTQSPASGRAQHRRAGERSTRRRRRAPGRRCPRSTAVRRRDGGRSRWPGCPARRRRGTSRPAASSPEATGSRRAPVRPDRGHLHLALVPGRRHPGAHRFELGGERRTEQDRRSTTAAPRAGSRSSRPVVRRSG